MLDEPTGFELPPKGFDVEDPGYQAPKKEDGAGVEVSCSSDIRTSAIINTICSIG